MKSEGIWTNTKIKALWNILLIIFVKPLFCIARSWFLISKWFHKRDILYSIRFANSFKNCFSIWTFVYKIMVFYQTAKLSLKMCLLPQLTGHFVIYYTTNCRITNQIPFIPIAKRDELSGRPREVPLIFVFILCCFETQAPYQCDWVWLGIILHKP